MIMINILNPHYDILYNHTLNFSVSGLLDDETAHVMSLPRCGVKDKVGTSSDGRSKRYALQGNITFKVFTQLLLKS